ncbi:Dam family site-specific DNA-(adenine-N6)-methyltransferase [Paraburkholderia sediminicola]|uniref:DNA adenine methylase n=1 Tax=Paraburkholderia sediminicola TaxID=458836 RepID=UPI0038BB9646
MRNHPLPQATKAAKPFLKWVGGKSRLLSNIIPALPPGRRLIEPFVGGGSVFLNAAGFEKYVLGDSNKHLIELYQTVAERPREFMGLSVSMFNDRFRTSERYLDVRRAFNSEGNVLMRSAQFLYLNRFAFNGLCRYNRAGQFNVPYGHPKRVPRFPAEQILAFTEQAQRATFVHGDFTDLMRLAEPGDVVYCDPPYLDRDGATSFRAYGPAGFGMDRQCELADLARGLAGRDIPVVVSNHDCMTARELYAGADIVTFNARRSVSAAAGSRGSVGEILAVFGAR